MPSQATDPARGSLTARLTLAAGVVLLVFLGLTGLALERAWRESALVAMKARLEAHLYGLIAATEIDAAGDVRTRQLADPRYGVPGSGLYAEIRLLDSGQSWQSASLMQQSICPGGPLQTGRARFDRVSLGGEGLFRYAMQVDWETPDGRLHPVRFCVAESGRVFQAQAAAFRRTLVLMLGGAGIMLLIAQWLVLRWGLRPLHTVARALEAVQRGERDRVGVPAPRELAPLVAGIDRLIENERAQRERYRHALDDLAHSLKTPLAVLRGLGETAHREPEACRRQLEEQTRRMDAIIGRQLQRAVSASRRTFLQPVAVRPVAQRLVDTLQKVYAEKGIEVEDRIPESVRLRVEPDDLMEMLGNLLDNAFKYGRGRIRLGFEVREGRSLLSVEDDGPGIPPERREVILQRGVRMDQSLPGQGIGLAATLEIAASYGAELQVGEGALGGARFVLEGLPSG